MDFAYLDKYGILHIVDEKITAEEFAASTIVETSIPNKGGFPVTDNGSHIIVYTESGKYKIGGVEAPISQLAKDYPAVDALIKAINA